MYILSKEEEGRIKLWAKDARYEYFKANKYIFVEETIEEKEIQSEERFEDEVAIKNDNKIQVEKLENIFTDENLSKIAKVLTYKQKLILSFYYIERKTDKEIAEILFSTEDAIYMRRKRALEKLRKRIGGMKGV